MKTPADQRSAPEPRSRSTVLVDAARRFAARRAGGPNRTGAVSLASWLLGIYGVLYAMIARDEGAVGSEMLTAALIGGVLLGGAAALRWGRVTGYWIGLAVAVLALLAMAGVVASQVDVIGGILLAVTAVSSALLLVRGDRLDAWHRAWRLMLLVVLLGVGFSATGVVALSGGDLFGFAVLLLGLTFLVGMAALMVPPTLRHLWWLAATVLFGSSGLGFAVVAFEDRQYPRWGRLAVAGVGMCVSFYGNAVALIVRLLRKAALSEDVSGCVALVR